MTQIVVFIQETGTEKTRIPVNLDPNRTEPEIGESLVMTKIVPSPLRPALLNCKVSPCEDMRFEKYVHAA